MQVHQRFEKSDACPTNESLLAFLQSEPGAMSGEAETQMVEHLAVCEFCEMTVELLRAYPNTPFPLPPSTPPVPEQLRQLFPTRRVHK